MEKVENLDPVQYLRGPVWLEVIVPLFKTNRRVKAVLSEIGNDHLEMLESALEEDLTPDDLAEQLGFYEHEFRVRCKEIHWLGKQLGSLALGDLCLVLAQEIFPTKSWQIIESDEYAVVVDSERSMVFDLQNFDELSALGALALCGEAEANQNPKAVEEALRFREGKLEKLEESLAQIKKDLARFSNEGTLLDFEKR